MKFQDLNGDELIKKLQRNYPDVAGYLMWGSAFYYVSPRAKSMKLKEEYKPVTSQLGMYSDYYQELAKHKEFRNFIDRKMKDNGFWGTDYFNKHASLKLHISINNIAEVDESIIQGLMELLIRESEAPDNNINFDFKFIEPSLQNERFNNTDQLTLYFDKYSSTADLILLTQKIEQYLLSKGIPANKIDKGPKDTITFNSFVSARFDTNKLLRRYDVYTFFDIELGKFFQNHFIDELKNVPLCAFEAVFNSAIGSQEVIKLNGDSGLSAKESSIVQAEFEKMLNNPRLYLSDNELIAQMHHKMKRDSDPLIQSLVKSLDGIRFDFSKCNTQADINKHLLKLKNKISDVYTAHLKIQSNANTIDIMMIRKCFPLQQERLNAIHLEAQMQSFKLLVQHSNSFRSLLNLIENKSRQLKKEGYSARALIAADLHQNLTTAFNSYEHSNKSKSDYMAFKLSCDKAISQAKPHLAEHRGWKNIFINVSLGIASLGTAFLFNYIHTQGEAFFFKTNTDSVNKIDQISQIAEKMSI